MDIKKIERLKELAAKYELSQDRVVTPIDSLMIYMKIDFAPMVFRTAWEMAFIFGLLSMLSFFVSVKLEMEVFSWKSFLQYSSLGVGVGLILYFLFVSPIQKKLNLTSWDDF